MKRSINFGGNVHTARRKAMQPSAIFATLDFLRVPKDEQRRILERMTNANEQQSQGKKEEQK